MKNIEEKIESLSEFMKKILEQDKTCYYRGEAKDYEKTKLMASGYRFMKENNKDLSVIMKLRRKYYYEVGYSLNSSDRKNFICFSQHHGLPTELLDVTLNPLVSLYFACCDNLDDDGYVYAIKSEKTLNMGDYIISDKIEEQEFNFIDFYQKFREWMYIGNEKNINLKKFDKLILDMMDNQKEQCEYLYNNIKFLKEKLNKNNLNSDEIEYIPIDLVSEEISKKIVNIILDDNKTIDKKQVSLRDLFKKEIQKHLSKEFNDINYYNNPFFYFEPFAIFISILTLDLVSNPYGNCGSNSIRKTIDEMYSYNLPKFPTFKYLLHTPSVNFDRMKNQDGKFIYQLAITRNTLDGDKYIFQDIQPNYTYKINKDYKKIILEQLSKIGISEKFVYNDPDHIANYVKVREEIFK